MTNEEREQELLRLIEIAAEKFKSSFDDHKLYAGYVSNKPHYNFSGPPRYLNQARNIFDDEEDEIKVPPNFYANPFDDFKPNVKHNYQVGDRVILIQVPKNGKYLKQTQHLVKDKEYCVQKILYKNARKYLVIDSFSGVAIDEALFIFVELKYNIDVTIIYT